MSWQQCWREGDLVLVKHMAHPALRHHIPGLDPRQRINSRPQTYGLFPQLCMWVNVYLWEHLGHLHTPYSERPCSWTFLPEPLVSMGGYRWSSGSLRPWRIPLTLTHPDCSFSAGFSLSLFQEPMDDLPCMLIGECFLLLFRSFSPCPIFSITMLCLKGTQKIHLLFLHIYTECSIYTCSALS